MCKFCKKVKENHPSLNDAEWKALNLYSNEWKARCPFKSILNLDTKEIEFDYKAYSGDSSFFTTLKIKFCPFCGRKL